MKTYYVALYLALLTTAFASDDPRQLVSAMTKCPWPGESYPALPSFSTAMMGRITGEIAGRPVLLEAFRHLDSSGSNNDWFDAIAVLEREKAIWSLQACLCHPHDDVQIHALRSLLRLGDRAAVPFLLIYADYMAVHESGSENATIHGIIHSAIAETLSGLTGESVKIDGQDPEALTKAIRKWTIWQTKQPD
jgi:hypothetical protein